jgi:hypothetical protein
VTDALLAFGGSGSKVLEYGPDDPFTKLFQESIGRMAVLADVKKNCGQESGRMVVGIGEAFVNALIDGLVGGDGFYNPNAQYWAALLA